MNDIVMLIIGIVFLGIAGLLCLFICAISTIKDIIERMEKDDDRF